jgi:hypothetical protein
LFAPVFAVLTQIFLWGLLVAVNDRFGNLYLTMGVLIGALCWQGFCIYEVYTYAMSHGAIEESEDDAE